MAKRRKSRGSRRRRSGGGGSTFERALWGVAGAAAFSYFESYQNGLGKQLPFADLLGKDPSGQPLVEPHVLYGLAAMFVAPKVLGGSMGRKVADVGANLLTSGAAAYAAHAGATAGIQARRALPAGGNTSRVSGLDDGGESVEGYEIV